MDVVKQVRLRYVGGTSNKVYEPYIERVEGGFAVGAWSGAYGGNMIQRKKAPSPVDEATAEKMYNALIKSKTQEGYTDDPSGKMWAGSGKEERDTGRTPQLLNSISRAEAMALNEDDDWVAQEKHDGERMMIHILADEVTPTNRRGLTKAVAAEVEADVKGLGDLERILDGEIIGTRYVAFDLVHRGDSIQETPYIERLELLRKDIPANTPHLEVAETAIATEQKKAMFERVEKNGGEGMVYKRKNSIYRAGRPNSGGDQRKFKFVKTATVKIGPPRKEDKRSMSMILTRDGQEITMGNVTILPNFDVPELGSFVEVEYLYARRDGALIQPIYKGPRTDKTEPDDYSSLGFKGEGAEDDS